MEHSRSRPSLHCMEQEGQSPSLSHRSFRALRYTETLLECVWNVMAYAQKPDFLFRRNGPVHLNRQGRQFSRLLAAEVCASAVVMLDTPCSELVWRVLATNSIRQFPLHFPSRASTCAITFQLESTTNKCTIQQFIYFFFYLSPTYLWVIVFFQGVYSKMPFKRITINSFLVHIYVNWAGFG